MARNPDNDIAKEFINTMPTVLLDAIRNFVHMHWDEIEKISVMAQDGEDLSDAIRDILKGDR